MDPQQVRYWKRYRYLGYECRVYEAALHERSDSYRQRFFEKPSGCHEPVSLCRLVELLKRIPRD